ncbi:hypothetical protein [Streptomyces sp. NPDC007905]|uniref:hypothetical protein n=1 Tax=Streptomyces sp. NPDC007905 TaxID=3364788 RepID=UPI0036E04AD2
MTSSSDLPAQPADPLGDLTAERDAVLDQLARLSPDDPEAPAADRGDPRLGPRARVPAGRAAVTPVPGDGGRTRRIVFMDE